MKVIFLDFDGVLNSERYFWAFGSLGLVLDPKCMNYLKEVVDATGAEIVLSTSWREHWEQDEEKCSTVGKEMNNIFAKYHLKIFDKTPFSVYGREFEVEAWLEEHPETSAFVVLDDRFLDSPKIRDHFVKTDAYFSGLEQKSAEKAIQILIK